MASTQATLDIEGAIMAAIKAEVAKIADEEAKLAAARVALRVRESVDRLALGVLSSYVVERGQTDIRITVRKDAP